MNYALDPLWTDLHNLASPWVPASGSTLALTADGYPLANASTYFSLENYPAGNYQFSYTGSGTVSFSGSGQVVGPVTTSGGVTTGTVAVAFPADGAADVNLQVTNVNTANPMDNFHLMMPGYGNGTTPEPMFTPAFLAALKPFSDIRFMDWEAINGSTLANWQNRVPPNAFLTDGSGGVPYEDMIELCNEAQKDMWINIPAEATPQFVQSMAQLIAAKLDPNLNVYVEYGNEDWNSGGSSYAQISVAAKSNPVLNQSLGITQLDGPAVRLHARERRPDLRSGVRGGQRTGAADPGRAGLIRPVPDRRAAVHPAAVRAALAVHLRAGDRPVPQG